MTRHNVRSPLTLRSGVVSPTSRLRLAAKDPSRETGKKKLAKIIEKIG